MQQAEFDQHLARLAPRAWVTPALVAINVLVFLAMAWATGGDSIMTPDGQVHIAWGSNFGPLTTDGQWWRMFTSMFLHFGLIHLALNMYGLWDGGALTERLYGRVEFLVLYVVSGLTGSAASLLWHPVINSAGASGAIFGVYGALLVYVLRPGNRVPVAMTKSLWTGTAIFLGYSLFNGMAREGIDNAAHVGGLLGGALCGLALARPVDATREPGTHWGRVALVALAAAVVLPLAASQVRNVGTSYKKETQYQADLKSFAAEEEKLNRAFTEWRALAKGSPQQGADLAARLERDVARPWREFYERVKSNPLDADARLKAHQDIVLEYLRLRVEAFELYVEAVRSDNRAKGDAAGARFAEASKEIEKLKGLKKGK